MKAFKLACLVLCLALSSTAWAETRASVSRTSIHADESVRLVIETDGNVAPDESKFNTDFVITARATGRSINYAGGRVRTSMRYEYELSPRRSGRIVIPSLRMGNDTTSALVVDVLDAAAGTWRSPNSGAASTSQDVFIRTTVETTQPYAQQGVLMTVRFYVGRSMIDAALDQPAIEGASMQQVASDVQTSQVLNGRTYQVVTRQYWVVPDRAGIVRIAGARLVGTTAGGFFDEAFGDGIERINAVADTLVLNVQPQPSNAADPWLPLHDLRLRYTSLPQSEISQSQPGRVTLEMVAEGALPADLPELTLRASNGAQVYPEPAQTQSAVRNGRWVSTITRTFSILPTQGGAISLTTPAINWWHIENKRNERAQLPLQTLQVKASIPVSQAPDASDAKSASDTLSTRLHMSMRAWIAGGVFALCVAVIAFLVWRRKTRRDLPKELPRVHISLESALASGDLADISAALCASCIPPTDSLEVVRSRLAKPSQQEAVAALQAARWGSAATESVLDVLRTAFASKPEWVGMRHETRNNELPPLYPTH